MIKKLILLVLFLISSNASAAIILGNPNGHVTLTEVFDYQCPHCRKITPVIQGLIQNNSDLKVRLLPVAVLNKIFFYEAVTAIALTQQSNKFIRFHDTVMHNPTTLNKNQIDKLIEQLHVDKTKLLREMHSKQTEGVLLEGLGLLKERHKSSVPLILIQSQLNKQGYQFMGETSMNKLQEAVNAVSKH